MTKPQTALAPIAPLQQALALATEAGDIPRLKDVASMAAALRKGAQARGLGIDAENQAAEVVLRAERAMGATLIALRDEGAFGREAAMASIGRQFGGVPAKGRAGIKADSQDVVTLDNLGLTRQASSVYQRLAGIPDAAFEKMLTETKGAAERLSRVKFIGRVKPTEEEAEAKRIHEYNRSMDAATNTRTTPLVASFAKAASALIEKVSQVPTEELVIVAGLIRSLAEAYNAEKNRRG